MYRKVPHILTHRLKSSGFLLPLTFQLSTEITHRGVGSAKNYPAENTKLNQEKNNLQVGTKPINKNNVGISDKYQAMPTLHRSTPSLPKVLYYDEMSENQKSYCQKISLTQSFDDIQSLLKTKLDTNLCMTEAVLTFSQMNYIYWQTRKNEDTSDKLLNSEEFIHLCNTTEMYLTHLQPRDLKTLLSFCANIKVSERSAFMQKILKLALENINKFSSNYNLLQIYLSLNNYEDTALVQSLQTACCEAVIANLDFAGTSVKPTFALQFVNKRLVPVEIRKRLLDIVLKSDYTYLNSTNYNNIINAGACIYQLPDVDLNITNKLILDIKNNVNETWSSRNLSDMCVGYAKGYSTKIYPYNSDLCNLLAHYLIKTKSSLVRASLSLLNLTGVMNHLSFSLLHYVYNSVLENPIDENTTSQNFLFLLAVTSLTIEHIVQDPNWEIYKKNLLSYPGLKDLRIEEPGKVRMTALHLIVLGVYKDDLINAAFDTSKLLTLNETSVHSSWILLLLHWSVKLWHPNYQGVQLSAEEVTTYSNFVHSFTNKILKGYLEYILGGDKYILQDCVTSLKHNLSYVILLGPDNEPMDLSSARENVSPDVPVNIEDIKVAEGCKLVVIQEHSDHTPIQFRNVPILRGLSHLYINILKDLGYTAVLFNEAELLKLNEKEVIEYIIRKIESSCGTLKLSR